MSIPDFQTVMLPLLQVIESGGDQPIREVREAMADHFGLTAEERAAEIPSGRGVTLISSRVAWAKAYLKQAGLVSQPRRGWVGLTERGKAVLRRDPPSLNIAFLEQFAEFRAFRDRSRPSAYPDSGGQAGVPTDAMPELVREAASSPEERLAAAARDLEVGLAAELLDAVRALSPEAFEGLIVDLLVGMGFGGSRKDAGLRLGRTGDGGVDGIIREDALGLDVIFIQAKKYAIDNVVGPEAIRGFAGALLGKGASKGVFVTTSRFTAGARADAEGYRSHRIVLIDGDELARMMMDHDIGVRTVQTIRVQKVDLSAYEDED